MVIPSESSRFTRWRCGYAVCSGHVGITEPEDGFCKSSLFRPQVTALLLTLASAPPQHPSLPTPERGESSVKCKPATTCHAAHLTLKLTPRVASCSKGSHRSALHRNRYPNGTPTLLSSRRRGSARFDRRTGRASESFSAAGGVIAFNVPIRRSTALTSSHSRPGWTSGG